MSGALGSAISALDFSQPDYNKLTMDNLRAQEAIQGFRSANALNQIFKQSTGPDGTVDYAKARGLIAQDPSITRGVLDAAGTSLEHQGKQQEHGRAALALVGSTAAYYANRQDANGNPMPATPDEVRDAIGFLGKSGALTPAGAKAALGAVPNDPTKLPGFLQYVQEQARGAQAQFESALPQGGTRATADAAGTPVDMATNRNRRNGAVTAASGNAAVTPRVPSPDTLAAESEVFVPDPKNPGRFLRVLQPRRDRTGATTAGPATSSANAPTPPPAGTTMPGAYPGRGAPSAASPPPPASGAAPPPAAPTAAGGGYALAAPPQGQPEGVAEDTKAYTAAVNAVPDQRRALIAGKSALDALELANSGPGSANVQKMKAFLISHDVPGAAAIDERSTEAYDIARKNLLRFAQANGRATGTDLGLETQIASNANVDSMVKGAARHVLVQDMGLLRQRVAQTMEAKSGGLDFREHVKGFGGDEDARGYSWDLYSPQQRAEIIKEASAKKDGIERLQRAADRAKRLGLWTNAPAAP